MVVEIAQEIILQSLKVFLSVRNKNSENFEVFIKHILSINALHKLHKIGRKTSGIKKEILSFIKNFSEKKLS